MARGIFVKPGTMHICFFVVCSRKQRTTAFDWCVVTFMDTNYLDRKSRRWCVDVYRGVSHL